MHLCLQSLLYSTKQERRLLYLRVPPSESTRYMLAIDAVACGQNARGKQDVRDAQNMMRSAPTGTGIADVEGTRSTQLAHNPPEAGWLS